MSDPIPLTQQNILVKLIKVIQFQQKTYDHSSVISWAFICCLVRIYTVTKQSATHNNDFILIVAESLFLLHKMHVKVFLIYIYLKRQKAFVPCMTVLGAWFFGFFFGARLIKIKSRAVSCSKKRMGSGQRMLRFVCPGLGTTSCAHTVYFHCCQSKHHSKDSQKKTETPHPLSSVIHI